MKKLINFTDEQINEIEKFRFENRIQTFTEALNILVKRGLNGN